MVPITGLKLPRCVVTRSPFFSCSIARVPSGVSMNVPAGKHGNPPAIRSTLGKFLAPTSRTSVNRGTPGHCLARTSRQNSSISTCQAHLHPARSRPRSIPPIPANNDPNVPTASEGDDVDVREIPRSDLPDVGESGNVGPVLGEDEPAELVDLDLESALPASSLEPEANSADAGAELSVGSDHGRRRSQKP